MNKNQEIKKLQELFEVESGLDTRLFELAGYPLIEDLVEKMFELKEQMNHKLDERVKALDLKGHFGVEFPTTK